MGSDAALSMKYKPTDGRVFPLRSVKDIFLPFRVRKGATAQSKLTAEARCNAVMDLLHFVDIDKDFQRFLQSREGRRHYPQPDHASRPRTPCEYGSDHYGIDVTVLRALVEEATERPDFFDPLPRAHRPVQWNP